MRSFVTKIPHLFILPLLFAWLIPVAQESAAQEPPQLGDEFIIFVEGLNVLVPESDFTAATDPTDPNNTVAKFGYGSWAAPGFRWPGDIGADMSEMVTPDGVGGKTLYLKLWVSPSLKGKNCFADGGTGFDPCLSISLFDASTGGGAADDREGRLKWGIPQEMMDGTWQNLAIPLPPDNFETWKDLKDEDLLDDLAKNWQYAGGWADGWGWGGTAGSPHGPADPNWQDFQWDRVRGITVHFDWNPDGVTGGDVLIDDIYIGDENTNIADAINPPTAMSGAAFAPNGDVNTVSWTHNPDFGGYNVYVDENPITQARIDAREVQAIKTVPFNAAEFRFDHRYEIPHYTLAGLDLYYAVSATNLFGVENSDVSASSGMISNPNLAQQALIVEVTNAQSDVIVNNVFLDNVSPEGFPPVMAPFVLDSNHSSAGDGGRLASSDDDLSGKLWVAFNRTYNEMYLYGEIRDDVLAIHPGGATGCPGAYPGCDTWGYDSVEMGFGNYDVRDVPGGTLLAGSPHESFERGLQADYQLRIAWLGDEAAPVPTDASTFISPYPGQNNELNQPIPQSKTVFADLVEGGNTVGYKFISAFNLAAIAFGGTGDRVIDLPSRDGIKLVPFNFALNDSDDPDATAGRDLQVQWSINPNASGSWWNTPAEWLPVAMEGINLATGVSNEELDGIPTEFVLRQNYPNPFNPTTNIEFALPSTESVTLTVFNVLGQRVATLLDEHQLNAGVHQIKFDAAKLSSGVYLYRLEAGKKLSQSRSMLLLK